MNSHRLWLENPPERRRRGSSLEAGSLEVELLVDEHGQQCRQNEQKTESDLFVKISRKTHEATLKRRALTGAMYHSVTDEIIWQKVE